MSQCHGSYCQLNYYKYWYDNAINKSAKCYVENLLPDTVNHPRPAFRAYKMLLGTSVDWDVGSLKANWALEACFLSGNLLNSGSQKLCNQESLLHTSPREDST